jgi:hypothetical protein
LVDRKDADFFCFFDLLPQKILLIVELHLPYILQVHLLITLSCLFLDLLSAFALSVMLLFLW